MRVDKKAERKSKEKQKAFEHLISLPSEQHETKLAELAKRFDEDVAVIRDDFTAFVGMDSRAATIDPWNVEPWPDPVKTQALLQEISAKISKYIVMRPEAVTATVLWTTMAWHRRARRTPLFWPQFLSNPIPARAPSLVFYAFWCLNRLSASNRLVRAYTVRLIANTRP